MERAIEKLRLMSDSDLLAIWEAIGSVEWDYDTSDPYDGVSMQDWVELVYSEKSFRGI